MGPLGTAPTPGVTVQPQAAFPCAGACWALQTAKLRVPNRARYPPNEGHRDSSMQGGAQPHLCQEKLLLLLLSELHTQLST